MIRDLSKAVSNLCIRILPEQSEYKELIRYGTESVLATIVNWAVIIAVGVAFRYTLLSVVFFACFAALRKWTGGYHADTYLKCNFLMAVNLIAVFCLVKKVELNLYFFLALTTGLFIISAILILIYAPLTDTNKKIHSYKKINIKIYALLTCMAIILFSVVGYILEKKELSKTLLFVILSVDISLLAGRTRKNVQLRR